MFRTNQRILLAKIESTVGTDPTPTISLNAIEAKNIRFRPQSELLTRDPAKQDISASAPIIGRVRSAISFECELKGSGTLGTAPRIGALLQACAFAETVSAGSSVIYDPSSTGLKTVTIYLYDIPDTGNAVLHKITGARGNFKKILEAGKFGRIEFELEGVFNNDADVSAPGTPTYETTLPPIIESIAFTLNGVTSLIAQSIEIESGNEVTDREDVNSPTGLKERLVLSRTMKGRFNPEVVQAATYDFLGDWRNATARAFSATIGSVAGNRITISGPKLTLEGVEDSDRNGILTRDIPFQLSRDTGNDEYRMKFH